MTLASIEGKNKRLKEGQFVDMLNGASVKDFQIEMASK